MHWNVELPAAEWYERTDQRLEELIRAVDAAQVVAIDTETTGLVVHRDMPLFWSLSFDDRRICMPADTLPLFRKAFANPNKTWVFANAKFDLHMLANYGVTIAGHIADTQVMHALLYEEQSHRLKDMALQLLQWKWLDFGDTFAFAKGGKLDTNSSKEDVAKGGRFIDVQAAIMWCYFNDREKLVEYAANDAFGTWKIYWHLKAELERNQAYSLYNSTFQLPMRPGRLLLKIDTQWDYFEQIEMPFTKVLYYVERNGILVDTKYLSVLSTTMTQKKDLAQRKLNQIAGRPINVNSPLQMRKLFIEEIGLKALKRTKGGKTGVKSASIDKDFVEFHEDNPAVATYGEIKKLDKLIGTYVDALPTHMDEFGRIHTRFNQDVPRCMPAGELVLTNHGYTPVEDVQIGDLVITHTGDVKPVLCTSTHAPEPIFKVTLANALVLKTNGAHAYWTGSAWVPAQDLHKEQPVVVYTHWGEPWTGKLTSNFAYSSVYSVEIEQPEPTYGLEVADDHSHVTGGIVTHNTGRLSSSGPNLQTIPSAERDVIYKIRQAFIAPPGQVIICLDYDQLEMRLLGAASLEPSMIATFQSGRDIHMSNAELIYGYAYDDIKKAKKMSKDDYDTLALTDPAKVEFYKKCVWARGAVKTVGFGQPARQAEVKPHQNGGFFAARAA